MKITIKHPALLIGLAIGTVLVTATVSILFFKSQNSSNDVRAIERKVAEHYLLPNEEPALATVEDKTKLSSDFLRSAENGDKLLIYKSAKKVILYRPSIDRIIEVGPISIAPTQQ